jgi:hypothetical protein
LPVGPRVISTVDLQLTIRMPREERPRTELRIGVPLLPFVVVIMISHPYIAFAGEGVLRGRGGG